MSERVCDYILELCLYCQSLGFDVTRNSSKMAVQQHIPQDVSLHDARPDRLHSLRHKAGICSRFRLSTPHPNRALSSAAPDALQ